MVAKVSKGDIDNINLHEGQRWLLFTQEEFFAKDDVVEALKNRFKDYLDAL